MIMRTRLLAVTALLLVTGATTSVSYASAARPEPSDAARTAAQVIAVPAHSIHSKAAATALGQDALDLVTFPAGSTRLATRPALGTADLNETPTITSLVSLTRWWSVPGQVADATAYLMANPPAGLTVQLENGFITLSWANGAAFSLDAVLVQDGDHVDVSLGSQVTWTPPKTAIETIPASVTSATLDFDGGYNNYGMDSLRVLKGAALAQLKADLNPNLTDVVGSRECGEELGGNATLTMRYSGHTVVFTIGPIGCRDIDVTSDGKSQPSLTCCVNGDVFTLVDTLAQAPSAPASKADPVPNGLLTSLTSKKATDAKDLTLLAALPLPPGSVPEPTPEGNFASSTNPDQHAIVESRWLSVPLTGPATIAWLTAHVSRGFSVAHLGVSYPAGTEIEEQPRGVYPSTVVLDINLQGSSGTTALRVDAEKYYLPNRAPSETIPLTTTSALLTFEPYPDSHSGQPTRRVDYHGKGLKTLISWFNSRPAQWYESPPCANASPATAKLGATFHVGSRVVTFYWYDDSCAMIAVVDGRTAPYLTGPPTALLEHLLDLRTAV